MISGLKRHQMSGVGSPRAANHSIAGRSSGRRQRRLLDRHSARRRLCLRCGELRIDGGEALERSYRRSRWLVVGCSSGAHIRTQLALASVSFDGPRRQGRPAICIPTCLSPTAPAAIRSTADSCARWAYWRPCRNHSTRATWSLFSAVRSPRKVGTTARIDSDSATIICDVFDRDTLVDVDLSDLTHP
jgi:hypothetical protein